MANKQNSGKDWTPDEIAQLRKLAAENTPTSVIALKLRRTEAAVQSKAVKERISLKPVNRSPYG